MSRFAQIYETMADRQEFLRIFDGSSRDFYGIRMNATEETTVPQARVLASEPYVHCIWNCETTINTEGPLHSSYSGPVNYGFGAKVIL